MIKIGFVLSLISFNALAYIPTVESLLRHGSNPDVTANAVSISLVVKKISLAPKTENKNEESLLGEVKAEDFYKIFYTKVGHDVFKVSQTRYDNSNFSEGSLLEKHYYPNFSPYTNKGSVEESEKGILNGMLISMIFNNGSFFVNYLKSLGVPIKLNNEIINRQKVTYLASYKQYLVVSSKDRSARKKEVNPLRPDDLAAREKIDQVMSEPMYVDQKQVVLSRENGEMAWLINAGALEIVVSYRDRDIQRIKFKSQIGEYEINCKDYWLANGTHSLPRYISIKDYKGEMYQIEILNMRHFIEKESDLISRLKKWDSILKGKESLHPKPPFLL